MSEASAKRAEEFLRVADQFQLGALTTEASHPATAELSQTAKRDVTAALGLLFEADRDVLRKCHDFAASGRARTIADTVRAALKQGGRMFFTGCGSTGRLSIQLVSIWREFWQQQRARNAAIAAATADFEDRAFSVMAGGDFALIKSVEGFEDFTAFGKKQLAELGVSARDVVFAITEGGETSFVIGTAWQGLEADAKVYFVYNNPEEVLCQRVQRSREVIQEPRIEKLNLTTGPMAITGSTRMQATTIQLCVLLTVLEMVVRDLMRALEPGGPCALASDGVPATFLGGLGQMHATLQSPALLAQLAAAVSLEESVYRAGHRNNYFAHRLAIDVLTDTTERSPTYCTPPFRKFDDRSASESWAFLFLPYAETPRAWEWILKRAPRCVEWTDAEVRALVSEDKGARTIEIVRKISRAELMRFRVGLDGLAGRPLGPGDSAVAIMATEEQEDLLAADGFYRARLEAARRAGASAGVICLGEAEALARVGAWLKEWRSGPAQGAQALERGQDARAAVAVLAAAPKTDLLLDGVRRAGLKMLLNALSTCTMVRLGRVMGNYMVWVVPSNLKLIDRSTRYVQKLTGLDYRAANHLLFEVVEYVEPRMKADQAYPPVVGLAVIRGRYGLGNEEAERKLAEWGE